MNLVNILSLGWLLLALCRPWVCFCRLILIFIPTFVMCSDVWVTSFYISWFIVWRVANIVIDLRSPLDLKCWFLKEWNLWFTDRGVMRFFTAPDDVIVKLIDWIIMEYEENYYLLPLIYFLYIMCYSPILMMNVDRSIEDRYSRFSNVAIHEA